jgi:laccase
VEYADAKRGAVQRRPLLAPMPRVNDTATAHQFFKSLAALVSPGCPSVPLAVDTPMSVTIGLGFTDCRPGQTRCR